MKRVFFLMLLILLTLQLLSAQNSEEIITPFAGSNVIYDDQIGYETHYYLTGENSHQAVDGKMRRQFCQLPADVSTYEVIKNYEKAIEAKGGTIIHLSRSAKRYTDPDSGERIRFMQGLFTRGRKANPGYAYLQLPNFAQDYLVGKISTAQNEIYLSVAATVVESQTYYELVTVMAEPMELGKVSLNVMNEGISQQGKIAIYDIYFDTGKSEVKSESNVALAIIANYLKDNPTKKYLIVGHTDNTGDFAANITLSQQRARAVIDKLINDFGIEQQQLVPYGVGSVSPQSSNATSQGRATNRRVELVEY